MDHRTLSTIEDVDRVELPERRAPGGTKVTVLLFLLALSFLGWAALPLVGLDSHPYAAALVALTQYAVPTGIVITLLCLLLRRWLITLVVGLVSAALVCSVAPRAIPDSPTPVQGTPLRIMTANLYFGEADAADLVDLVRRNQVDVLSAQEITPELQGRLDRAGLSAALPYRVSRAQPGAAGTAIMSRYPLSARPDVGSATFKQPSALIDLPTGQDVEFAAVHPVIPVGSGTNGRWRDEVAGLPDPPDSPRAAPRVLAGDFNATLDHSPLRGLLGRGYEDAAEVSGDGLVPTWPATGGWRPPVTIDHVLVSGRLVVQGYETFTVRGTDHHPVLAHVVVPG